MLSLALLFVLVFLYLLPLWLGDILFLPGSSVHPSVWHKIVSAL